MERALYTYAVIVLAGALGLGGYNGVEWCDVTGDQWAAWAAAIGTVGTLVGAVWIAAAESRRRERTELINAQLMASGIVLRLAHISAAVAEVCRELDKISKVDQGLEPFYACADALERLEMWQPMELAPLVSLPMVAVDLAEASDQIRTAVKAFRRTGDILKYRDGPERMLLAKSIHPLLSGTFEKVERSGKACRAASLDLQKYSHGNIHISSPIVSK